MFHKVLPLLIVAVLAGAAAPPPKAPAAKAPAAKAPAARAAPAPAAPAFDARDPASLMAVLNAAGAKAQLGQKAQDTVQVAVASTAANFSVLFVGCDAQGRACQAAVFDSAFAGTASLQQLNGFNQSSAMCRGYQDKAGRFHVLYSVLTFANTTRDQVLTQLGGWQGCLGDFGGFLRDPTTYLANAP